MKAYLKLSRRQRSGSNDQRRDQGGFTLIEALVATLVIAATIAGATAGLNTLTAATTGANEFARIDAIINSYGEAIKASPYVECSTTDELEDSLAGLDDRSVAREKLARDSTAGSFSVEILTIEHSPPCPHELKDLDGGVQTVTYKVTRLVGSQLKSRTGVVTKLNPNGSVALPHAIIDTPVLATAPGDVVASYLFTATGSFGERYDLEKYEWNCGGRNETPILANDFGTPMDTPDTLNADRRGKWVDSDSDPNVYCTFPASSTGPTDYSMSLIVHDVAGQESLETTVTVTVPQALVARLPPEAVATATPAGGTVPITIAFSSAGSRSPGGDIASFRWDFKDPASGASNTANTASANHTFTQPGVYDVTLTVTDDIGVQATDIAQVTVSAAAVPYPIARFTAPSPLVAPTRAIFDGSASTTGTGGVPSVYRWTFSDGGTATGAIVNHDFLNPGTFNVTLTVEDSAGRASTTTGTVVVIANVAPSNFRVVSTRSYVPCLFFGCPGARTGYFDFGWTNQPRSPGDTVTHEINVTALQGCVAWASQTRSYGVNAVGTWQVVRWEEPTTNPFDLSTQICAGSVYNYKMRVKRVNSMGTFYSDWSPTQRVTI